MKRYIRSNKILYPDVTELMVMVFTNEYESLNSYGKKLFDEQYPGWSDTNNIRKYFYDAFDVENSIKSMFRNADNNDIDRLQQNLADLEYLGSGNSYEKWLAEKLILAIS